MYAIVWFEFPNELNILNIKISKHTIVEENIMLKFIS